MDCLRLRRVTIVSPPFSRGTREPCISALAGRQTGTAIALFHSDPIAFVHALHRRPMPLLRRLLAATMESRAGRVLVSRPPAPRAAPEAPLLPTPAVARLRAQGKFLFVGDRSEEHTSELQSRLHLVCRLLLEKKKKKKDRNNTTD